MNKYNATGNQLKTIDKFLNLAVPILLGIAILLALIVIVYGIIKMVFR